MWVPKAVLDWFQISKDTVDHLRSDLAATSAELSTLRIEHASLKVQNDWFRIKVNQLEAQNAALLEKAYNIKVPVPELTRASGVIHSTPIESISFEDMGDELARQQGFPAYDRES